MKLSTKKWLLGAGAALIACTAAATINLNVSNTFEAAADSQPVIDFVDSQVTLSGNNGAAVNFVTDAQGAATAAKFTYSTDTVHTAGWCIYPVTFKEPLNVDDAYAMSIRFYVHLTTKTSTYPFVSIYSDQKGEFVMYQNVSVSAQEEWMTYTISRSDYLSMAHSNGQITGFDLWLYPGDSATLFSDSYVLVDEIVIDDSCVITLDNDKAETGLDPTEVRVKEGAPLEAPASQIYGKSVTWYEDAARTIPVDFTNKTVTRGLKFYGKYSNMTATKGVVADCTPADTRYFKAPSIPTESSGLLGANCMSYVTDLDTDGDGIVDAKNAVKISLTGQWNSFALEFATPLDVTEAMSVTFRMYVDIGNIPTGAIWAGEGSKNDAGEVRPYQHGVIPWQDLVQKQWYEYTISSEDSIAQFAGEDGKFDSFLWALGIQFTAGQTLPAGSCVYIDSITYSWACNVTFDCDTENSGIRNVTETYASGKKISTAPKATEKAGYAIEWYTDEARTIPFDLKSERVESDITLYAKYVLKKLVVTFDYIEYDTGIPPIKVEVDANQTVTAPDETREGYTIVWFMDEDFIDEFDFDQPITKNITLYARYTPINNGGNNGGNNNSTGDNNSTDDNNSTGESAGGLLAGCGASIVSEAGIVLAALTGIAATFVLVKGKKEN